MIESRLPPSTVQRWRRMPPADQRHLFLSWVDDPPMMIGGYLTSNRYVAWYAYVLRGECPT